MHAGSAAQSTLSRSDAPPLMQVPVHEPVPPQVSVADWHASEPVQVTAHVEVPPHVTAADSQGDEDVDPSHWTWTLAPEGALTTALSHPWTPVQLRLHVASIAQLTMSPSHDWESLQLTLHVAPAGQSMTVLAHDWPPVQSTVHVCPGAQLNVVLSHDWLPLHSTVHGIPVGHESAVLSQFGSDEPLQLMVHAAPVQALVHGVLHVVVFRAGSQTWHKPDGLVAPAA
jgi:hypothetical protein